MSASYHFVWRWMSDRLAEVDGRRHLPPLLCSSPSYLLRQQRRQEEQQVRSSKRCRGARGYAPSRPRGESLHLIDCVLLTRVSYLPNSHHDENQVTNIKVLFSATFNAKFRPLSLNRRTDQSRDVDARLDSRQQAEQIERESVTGFVGETESLRELGHRRKRRVLSEVTVVGANPP